MSGPIIRSGPSSLFTQNWAGIFGKKKKPGTAMTVKKSRGKCAEACGGASGKSTPRKSKKKSGKKA